MKKHILILLLFITNVCLAQLPCSVPAVTTVGASDKFMLCQSGTSKYATLFKIIDTTKTPYFPSGRTTGFLKFNGTRWVFDNSTYLTTSSALATYIPLAGTSAWAGNITSTGIRSIGHFDATYPSNTAQATFYGTGGDLYFTQFGAQTADRNAFIRSLNDEGSGELNSIVGVEWGDSSKSLIVPKDSGITFVNDYARYNTSQSAKIWADSLGLTNKGWVQRYVSAYGGGGGSFIPLAGSNNITGDLLFGSDGTDRKIGSRNGAQITFYRDSVAGYKSLLAESRSDNYYGYLDLTSDPNTGLAELSATNSPSSTSFRKIRLESNDDSVYAQISGGDIKYAAKYPLSYYSLMPKWAVDSLIIAGGGGGSYTASDGVTLSGSNFTLGGTFSADRTIALAGFKLGLTKSSTGEAFSITNGSGDPYFTVNARGIYTTAIGFDAGLNATGTGNIIIGSNAGVDATSAVQSTFIGGDAGKEATNASNSTFIGSAAGQGATNAAASIFIGSGAGYSDVVDNTVSGKSILIGDETSTGGFKNSIGLGSGATNTAANQFLIDDSYTQFNMRGINWTMPSAQGGVGTVLTNNGSGVLSWGAGGGGSGTVNSGTANQLAYYATTGTAVSGLTSANNGVLVTNGSGVPSIATTLPNINLGTPTAAVLTNATGLPLSTGVTGQLPLANIANSAAISVLGRSAATGGVIGDITATLNNQVLRVSGGVIAWGNINLASTMAVGGILAVGNGGTGMSSQTTGSIMFAASASLAQDNSNLFWDNTNKRLGLGTSSPTTRLHAISTTEQLRVGYDASNYYSTTVSSTGFPTFDAVGTSPKFTFSDPLNIKGTLTNDAASAGDVGEHVSSCIASGSAVSLTTATAANVTSISLTAGDWMVSGNINYIGTTATVTGKVSGISSTSATIPTDGSEVYSGVQTTTSTVTDGSSLSSKRFSLSGTVTIYLVANSTFSAGSVSAYGCITARRVR